MMVATTDTLPGREVTEVLGIVFGSCVQTKHVGKDIRAMGRTMIGGEAKGYTELMEESRRTAMQRMIEDAKKLGADLFADDAVQGVKIIKEAFGK